MEYKTRVCGCVKNQGLLSPPSFFLSDLGYFLRAFIVLEAKVLSMSIRLSWVCSGLCLMYNDACLWWIPGWDKE